METLERRSAIKAPTPKPSAAVMACGIGLVLVCAVPLVKWIAHGFGLHPGISGTSYANRSLIFAAAIPFIGGLILLHRGFQISSKLIAAFGVAALVLLIPPPPLGSQDVFSYIFYGKMAVHGLSPLALEPTRLQHDPWFSFVLWRHAPSVYGPVWMYICTAIAFLARSNIWIALILMKLVAASSVVAAAFFLSRLAREDQTKKMVAVACLWNPLVLFSTANTAHVDGLLLGITAAALFARRKDAEIPAALLLAAATLIKIYCGVFLVLYLLELIFRKRNVWKPALAAAAAATIAYLPWWSGRSTFAGIYKISGAFSHTLAEVFREQVQDMLAHHQANALAYSRSVHITQAVSFVVFALAFAGSIVILHRTREATTAWGASFGAYLLVAPWLLPWYDLPLIGIALAHPAPFDEGFPLVAAALAFSFSSSSSQPVIRYLIPLLAAGIAYLLKQRSRSLLRLD